MGGVPSHSQAALVSLWPLASGPWSPLKAQLKQV